MRLTCDERMTVAGHRGDSYNCFENTMTAFKQALEAGADMIETDVRLSRDGKMVLIHDETVERTAHKKGRVGEMSFEELRALNVGNKNHPESIPTLEELLSWASREKVALNLELKEYYTEGNEERCVECIEGVISLVEKYEMTDRVVINSFDAWILEHVYKRYGKKYLLHGFYPYWEMMRVSINPDEYLYCACIFDDTNKAHYDYLAKKGIEAWIGASATQRDRLELCWEYGARLVTTNNPADTIKKLKEIHG
ncbi:MAG: hypothetical protein J6B29_01710 [Clostridia bacterium]|nr:hypothetical protein [Clostridia bacterium]